MNGFWAGVISALVAGVLLGAASWLGAPTSEAVARGHSVPAHRYGSVHSWPISTLSLIDRGPGERSTRRTEILYRSINEHEPACLIDPKNP